MTVSVFLRTSAKPRYPQIEFPVVKTTFAVEFICEPLPAAAPGCQVRQLVQVSVVKVLYSAYMRTRLVALLTVAAVAHGAANLGAGKHQLCALLLLCSALHGTEYIPLIDICAIILKLVPLATL